jgi:5-formyltetrahydrofolate cyclo-ligase
LGYGGGFYDRTLSALREKGRILALGIAYAAQQVEKVPTGYYDRPLDGVITEKEAFFFQKP